MATIKQIKDTEGNVHDILSMVGWGTCKTAAATAAKVATIDDTSWTLRVGSIIGIKYTYSNTAGSSTTPVTLNVNSTGAKNIWYNNEKYTGTITSICGYAGRTIYYMYDGENWVWFNSGTLDGNTNTVPCIQIETAAATAAKTGTCTNYSLLANSYAHANVRYSNTSKGALTLNVNSKGAKAIYINGTASSSSNYTLPAGTYIIYYDGTNYHFRTDGVLPNLPTIGNGKITITQNGTEKGSFTLNQSGNTTIELTDNNSHYTSKNIVGSSSTATSNAAVTSNGVYLNHLEESAVKSSHKISGSGTVSVTSDSNGNITITGSNHQSPGNGKITIVQAGIEKGSFTLNQSDNATIELKDTLYDPLLVEVSYDELKGLREGSELIPGQQYRITDYVTTTTQENTESAGHQFDIIVTALNEYTLSEEAHVIQNIFDGYFDGENHHIDGYFSSCNLEAWKIWYCLDNDINRFGWADEDNGKGVIYRMIDEWGNDCPYDFKNIKFKRGLYADGGGIVTKNSDEDFFAYCYTFSWEDIENGIIDASIFGNNGSLLSDEGQISGVYGNIIGVCNSYVYSEEEPQSTKQYLNDIVFFSTYGYDGGCYYGCYSNTFGNDCISNTFGNDCYSNTFGNNCFSNTFGDFCSVNTFGNSCYSNTFGDYCYGNTFGNSCYSNTFGNDCSKNTFGDYCYGNTFGYYCHSNAFNNSCSFNIFGNSCYSNTFGNSCSVNTFGDYCYSNTFGNNCYENTFGNNCYSNTFGNDCSKNTFGDYCYGNTFGYYCHSNAFNISCLCNTFGNYFHSSDFGRNCTFNTFGNYCYSNTFGENCKYNTFSNSCANNIFGNNCYGNTFGNSCYENTFGNECNYNTFGDYCYKNKFGTLTSTQSYYRHIIFDNGNRYIYLYSNVSKGSSKYYQNVRIGLGVNNTATYKTITDSNVAQAYETWYRPTNSKTNNI